MNLKTMLFFMTCSIQLSCNKQEVLPPMPSANDVSEKFERGANDETARLEYEAMVDRIVLAYEINENKIQNIDTIGIKAPCGIWTIDTIGGNTNIKFTGSCNERQLEGNATLELIDKPWRDKDAQLKISVKNYKITFLDNNQYIIINGSLTITNVQGRYLIEIEPHSGNYDRQVKGELEINYSTGRSSFFNISKNHRFRKKSKEHSSIQKIITGLESNILESGTNEYGHAFTSNLNAAIEYYNCKADETWPPVFHCAKGEYKYTVGNTYISVTYGQKLKGASYVYDQTCNATGFKVFWNFNGGTKETFVEY